MSLFSRHKNTVTLAIVLLIQLLALGAQVRKQTAEGPVQAIRLVTVDTVAAFERVMLHSGSAVRGVWTNYIDLRHVRRENQRLEEETGRMRLERAREQEEIRQAHRIQALLEFKQQWIDTTVAAQVIGTSGMETSRLLYLDKGTKHGIRPDMPVITPDGVVGKVLAVSGDTAQVLMINDPSSGVGAVLVNSRLQGVVKGTPTGGIMLDHIMLDQSVQPGEALVTSGGDRVFPKGVPVGTVIRSSAGHNLMLDIALKPAANLNRLEEVLVITQQKARAPETAGLGPVRASDILAEHLPAVPTTAPPAASAAPAPGTKPPGTAPAAPKPGIPPSGMTGVTPSAPRPAVSGATPSAPRPASPAPAAAASTAAAATTLATPKPASPAAASKSSQPKSSEPKSPAPKNPGTAQPKTAQPAGAADRGDLVKPHTPPGTAPSPAAPSSAVSSPAASSNETH